MGAGLSPALQAHLRLLTQTPRERIHTHEQRPPNPTTGIYVQRDVAQRRREAIAEMSKRDAINPATGKRWSRSDIAERLGISTVAVSHHRRVLRGGNYRHKGAR